MNLKINRIIRSAVCAVLTAFLLAGCSDISFGEQTLLRPPRATGDKAEIQTVIKEQAGSDYMLKYPQTGDFRSAVTLFETGQQNSEYAVAFYSTENNTKLNISIISHEDEKWKCLGSYNNSGTGVDRIIFEDLNNDGSDEILVGWSTYNTGQNTLSAYSIENGTVREMAIDEIYTEILIFDITQDKSDDLVLLSLRNDQTPSSARVLQYSEQEKRPIVKFSVELDSDVVAFADVQCGKVNDKTQGIVIDGSKNNGQLTTQVLYFDSQKQLLLNPLVLQNENHTTTNSTTRKNATASRDINYDGIIEVPVVAQMSAPSDTDAGSICSITSWKQLNTDDGSLKTELNTVMNYTDGYYMIMPEDWGSEVTCISDAENREMNFYIWDSQNSSLSDKVLTIFRFTRSDWDNADKDKYIMVDSVKSNGTESVIAAQVYNTGDGKPGLSESEITKRIKLIV